MVVLEEGSMLTTGHNQYLQPDYLSPLPTTVSIVYCIVSLSNFSPSDLSCLGSILDEWDKKNIKIPTLKTRINAATVETLEPQYFFSIIFHDFLFILMRITSLRSDGT